MSVPAAPAADPALRVFGAPIRAWFAQNFGGATEAQARGWPVIAAGRHTLIIAPTGSGKTLAAFLWGIDRLLHRANAPDGVRILYVSPLKALVYDVERNLRAPLVGVQRMAERLGEDVAPPRIGLRTGDTPQSERRLLARQPPEILVTTPESLFLLLSSKAREGLRTTEAVIVDEVHALAPSKRGAHLLLSLERLAEICAVDPQRIGLTATIRPAQEAARFLGGDRPVEIVDVARPPALDLSVRVPVADMERVPAPPRPGGAILGELYSAQAGAPPAERGIWSALYPAILEEIRANRSTIVFVNSRGLCERLCQHLNELAGEELVRAHHGSVSHPQRAEIEDGLKRGSIRAIVATSTLELGIDMGAVDRVLLVESPRSVARGLQRAGRAGHGVGQVSVAHIYPKYRGDLLECALVAQRMRQGGIEHLEVPRNALDVLAQQLVAMCTDAPREVADIERLVRRAWSYRTLARAALVAVLDMLSGRYPSSDFGDLRPLLVWDREADRLRPRRGAAMILRLNAGTIPDRGNYGVYLGEGGPRVGELDEEMVFETRNGDLILLGASTWRVEAINRDRVLVSPAPGEPGRLPFWRGEGAGRPVELGRELGAFTRRLGALSPEQAIPWLEAETPLDGRAARNLAAYVHEQKQHTGTLPTDRDITVEHFRDELGDWRVCILTPFGARVHAPWAMALQNLLGRRSGFEVQLMYSDDGIVLRLADTEALPELAGLLPEPEDVEDLVTEQLADTALFAGLFRENAVRSLLMPRRSGKGRQPLWAQRLKAQQLLAAVRRYPAFPIVLETYRQALGDVFDLPALRDLLTDVRARRVRVHEVETPSASPFARSLVFAYVAAYIYEQDSPLAERKAQALTLDRNLLAELLGQAELRDLIDPEVLAELEAELQHLSERRRARDADEVQDLLRRLGDLSGSELAERSTGDATTWLAVLEAERRAVRVSLASEARWIAAEDAGLYRDTLGAVPPPGLPADYLAPAAAPMERLLQRYARCRGPFTTAQAALRYGLRSAQIEPVLRLLAGSGQLVYGEIRPGGSEPEWCDAGVMRQLRRRTLARLRRQAAPVEAPVLGRFLPQWHGLQRSGREHGGTERLLEALGQLEGLALPWSALSMMLLPARVPEFRFEDLDLLAATGQVVWIGRGALGPRDGRVALYLRAHLGRLLETEVFTEEDPIAAAILAHLDARGASFLMELEQAVRDAGLTPGAEEFKAALWDLVWAGQITNDTFAPLRGLAGAPGRRRRQSFAGGRWSRVAGLVDPGVSDTERALARVHMLLERYGVVSRDAAMAEGLPGGFAPLYQVLKTMEETGRVRRGWFVEGLSGAQFAQPGAVDRLRAARPEEVPTQGWGEEEVLVLAALDPANPYGALLPWPDSGAGDKLRPKRTAGAWVVLVAGRPVLYLGSGGRHLISFPGSFSESGRELERACAVLPRIPRVGRRRLLTIEKIDGLPVRESPHRELLLASGFVSDYRGLVPGAASTQGMD